MRLKSLTQEELGQGQEEHKSEDEFEKKVEECEDPECRDHTLILYKGLSNQRTT